MNLIDKDTLVSEIQRRLNELWDLLPNASDVIEDNYTKEEVNITGKYTALESFENFINTLEPKNVDLEKELSMLDRTLFDLDGVAVKGATISAIVIEQTNPKYFSLYYRMARLPKPVPADRVWSNEKEYQSHLKYKNLTL